MGEKTSADKLSMSLDDIIKAGGARKSKPNANKQSQKTSPKAQKKTSVKGVKRSGVGQKQKTPKKPITPKRQQGGKGQNRGSQNNRNQNQGGNRQGSKGGKGGSKGGYQNNRQNDDWGQSWSKGGKSWGKGSKGGKGKGKGGDNWNKPRLTPASWNQSQDGIAITVSNIPHEMTWQDLKDAFQDVCKQGNVLRCDLRNGVARVTFESKQDARQVTNTFHGGDLNGSKISVRMA